MVITLLRNPTIWKRRGKSRSSHYADIGAGLFVKPIQIGPRAVATPDYEVDQLVAATIAGRSKEEIVALVKKLEAERVQVGQEAQQ